MIEPTPPEYVEPSDADRDVHDFLLEGTKHDPVELTVDIRDRVESLPPGARTFRLPAEARKTRSWAVKGAVALVGAWPMPDHYTNHSGRFVNPHADDARRYADAAVRCEGCDALVTQSQLKKPGTNPLRVGNAHDDECPMYHRLETTAKLWRERERIVVESLYYGVRGQRLATRLSLRSSSLTRIVEHLGVDCDQHREAFRDRRANTAAELARRGYDRKTIAAAYGVDPSQITRDVKRATGQNVRSIKGTA